MSEIFLKKEEFLEQAEREFLFGERKDFFHFEIRRKAGVGTFYEQLEKELKQQNLFQVSQYREVKEGFVKISRPAVLQLFAEALLKEKPHLKLLKSQLHDWEVLYGDFVAVKSFIEKHKDEAFQNIERTKACFETYKFLMENKEDIVGLLPRQIPHGNSTKLIGKESLLLKIFSCQKGKGTSWADFFEFFGLQSTPPEFRFYAPSVTIDSNPVPNFHGVMVQGPECRFTFDGCHGTLIVENWQSFYALTRMELPCLLIWGAGWKASLLRSQLGQFPGPLYYWGDIDKEGLEIFGYLKSYLSDLKSIYMDENTYQRFKHLTQKKEPFVGPFRQLGEFQDWYEKVCVNGIQIEQEQMTLLRNDLKDFFKQ